MGNDQLASLADDPNQQYVQGQPLVSQGPSSIADLQPTFQNPNAGVTMSAPAVQAGPPAPGPAPVTFQGFDPALMDRLKGTMVAIPGMQRAPENVSIQAALAASAPFVPEVPSEGAAQERPIDEPPLKSGGVMHFDKAPSPAVGAAPQVGTPPPGTRGPGTGLPGGQSLMASINNVVHPYGDTPAGRFQEQVDAANRREAENQKAGSESMEGLRSQATLAKQGDLEAHTARAAQRMAEDQKELARQKSEADVRAKFKVDPNRLMAGKSVFQKIMLGIAAGAKGASMGLLHEGGENPVLKGINDEINQDIKLQQGDYERMKERGLDAQNLYEANRKISDTDEEAHEKAAGMARDLLIDQMDEVKQGVSSKTVINTLDAQQAALRAQNAREQAARAAAGGKAQAEHDRDRAEKKDDEAAREEAAIKLKGAPEGAKAVTPEEQKAKEDESAATAARDLQFQKDLQDASGAGPISNFVGPTFSTPARAYNGVKSYVSTEVGKKNWGDEKVQELLATYPINTANTNLNAINRDRLARAVRNLPAKERKAPAENK